MAKKQARGLRNNNPGNIDFHPTNKWQGQLGIETDVPYGVKPRFAKFKAMEYGIRAIARLLIRYADDYDINTIFLMVSRWAPSIENDVTAYAKAIAKDVEAATGNATGIHTIVDFHRYEILKPTVTGIIEHENGLRIYTDAVTEDQVIKGLLLAGVEKPKKAVASKPSVQVATGAVALGGAGVVSAVVNSAATFAPAVPVVNDLSETIQTHPTGFFILFGLVVIGFGIFIIMDRLKQRRRGLS